MKELIVYPTPHLVQQHRMRQLQGKKGVVGEEPITYEIFVDRCIKHVVASKMFMGDFKKNLVLKNIIQKLKIQNKLKYFDTIRQGYVQRIGEVIGELKQQDIDVDTFDAMISNKPCHNDLSLIYRAYQEFLSENHFYDQEDRYILCEEHVLESSFITGIDKVHFKEFYSLSPIQQKIVDALGDKAVLSNSKLESNMKEIRVVRAHNRRTEVVNLAQVILEDLGEGLLPHNLCIVLRERELYEHILLEVFQEMGIPICLQLQAQLLHNPFIKALLKFLQGGGSEYFPGEVLDESIQSKKSSIMEWVAFVVDFLERKGLPTGFCDVHSKNLFLLKRDLNAFEAMVNLFDELIDVGQIFSDECVDLQDFIANLNMYLGGRYYTYRESSEGVLVLSPAMLRGLKFDKVYVPGMVEGEFPRDFRPDWLLKDWERAAFNEKGYAFDTLDILLEKEEEAFDFILTSARAGYFSYPNLADDNSAVLMSSYLEKLLGTYATSIENLRLESTYNFEGRDYPVPEPGVISDITRDKLGEYFKERPFSATAFNMYGECPYKFFLARVLNLSPPEEEGEYTALARGTVLHKILETFFKNHSEGLKANKLDEYVDEIKALTHDIMVGHNLKENFLHPLLFEIEKNQIAESIINYIASYLKQAGDFKPIHFEMGFGYEREFAFDFAPDILFSGKIDRIDEDPKGRLVVFDYKSGSTPDIKQIEEGTNLQMPLYIMACEQLLKQPVAGGAFISLKKADVDNILVRDRDLPFVSKRRKKGILSQEQWDELMTDVKSIIREYADNIRAAHFPIQPKKCPKTDVFGSFCDFTSICPWEVVEE